MSSSDLELDYSQSPMNSQHELRCTPVEGSLSRNGSVAHASVQVSRGGTPQAQSDFSTVGVFRPPMQGNRRGRVREPSEGSTSGLSRTYSVEPPSLQGSRLGTPQVQSRIREPSEVSASRFSRTYSVEPPSLQGSRRGTPQVQSRVCEPSDTRFSSVEPVSHHGRGTSPQVQSRVPSLPPPARRDPPVIDEDIFKKHWEKVPDKLKRITMAEVPFMAQNILPREEHVITMDARSKCFKLLDPKKPVLTHPTHGLTYCFVDKCMTEIPKHIQESLWFFSLLSGEITQHLYFVPTREISVQTDRQDPKVVTSLYTKAPVEKYNPSSRPQQDSTINMRDFIKKRSLDTSAECKIMVPFINLHVGFTGAIFEVDGEEKTMNFCSLFVTPAANFALWEYVREKFLKRPKKGCQGYEKQMEDYRNIEVTFRDMMQREIYGNMGLDERDFGIPSDFTDNPDGFLGTITILCSFQLPFKVMNIIRKEYPTARNIRISGVPQMSFRGSCDVTQAWMRYTHHYITEGGRGLGTLLDSLDQYHALKKKEDWDAPDQACVGGWPLEIEEDGTITSFGLPPLPLMHEFKGRMEGPFDVWLANMGGPKGIPQLTESLLRNFPNSRWDVPYSIDHFLLDKRVANPMEVSQKYDGVEDPLNVLRVCGKMKHWWRAVNKDIRARRLDNQSIDDVRIVFEKYILGCIQNSQCMIQNGSLSSLTMEQAYAISERMEFEKVCTDGPNSIKGIIQGVSGNISTQQIFDPYIRTLKTFWRIWEKINADFSMNSGNLVFLIELMISQLMYRFGDCNESWTHFFMAILIMSGNGHFEITGKDGKRRDSRKPNTTGFDWSISRLCELLCLLDTGDEMTKQTPVSCMRWTGTSFEELVTASFLGKVLQKRPNNQISGRAIYASEIRDSNLQGLVHYLPRGEQGESTQCAVNTCDADKTGIRDLIVKYVVDQAVFLAGACNKGDSDMNGAEVRKSLSVVSTVLPPGASPHVTKRKADGTFNYFETDLFVSRQNPIKEKTAVLNSIVFTHIFTQVRVGLPNRLGMIPFEVNPVVGGFLDWTCMYLYHFGAGIMDTYVVESFNRMKEGYKARGITLALWVKMIMHMAEGKSKLETTKNFWLDAHVHALPMSSIPVVLCSLFSRGVHMPSLLMTAVIAKDLRVPVISWKGLKRFFDEDQAPTEDDEHYREFALIKTFVKECMTQNRFCPENNGLTNPTLNISPYVTGSGNNEFKPLRTSIFRVFDPRINFQDNREIFKAISMLIKVFYGNILFRTCHMGPEPNIYANALEYLTSTFMPDFRTLLSHKMFWSKKHMEKLGFSRNIPGLQNYNEVDPPAYAKTCLFDSGSEIRSAALGVNIWSLLATVSMGASTIHPHVSDDFSKNFIKEIISNSPPSFTPSNTIPIRSFNLSNTKNEEIILSPDNRPEHLLRPGDVKFVISGALNVGKVVEDKYMVEDMAHNSFLPSIAELYKCKILEVPASCIKSKYECMTGRHYAYHVPGTRPLNYGHIFFHRSTKKVEINMYIDVHHDAVAYVDFMEWDKYLQDNSMVLAPMISRGGACIKVNMDDDEILGCLIKSEEGSNLLFKSDTCSYKVSCKDPETVAHVFFLDALEALVPVGEVVYLDLENTSIGCFRMPGKFLYARLNVPHVREPEEGKLYVSFLTNPSSDPNDLKCVTMVCSGFFMITVL